MTGLPITVVTRDKRNALTLDVRRMIIARIVDQAIKDVDVDKSIGDEGRYAIMAEAAALAAIAADYSLDDLEKSDDFAEAIEQDE